MEKVAAVILAAGKGTRMKSALPKILHKVCGKPMVQHVLEAAWEAGAEKRILVVGFGRQRVEEALGPDYDYVEQKEQLGTGHAVKQTADLLADYQGDVLVICGDTPLLRGETLKGLLQYHRTKKAKATILTAHLAEPFGYGRIIRSAEGQVEKIVEEKDASAAEKAVQEINTGTYCFSAPELFTYLNKITTDNAQGEYYLTDVIALLRQDNLAVEACLAEDADETGGVNSRRHLAEAERLLNQRTLQRLMDEGVTIVSPENTFIQPEVQVGQDTVIYPFTILEGRTVIGSDCFIGPNSRIANSVIGQGTIVEQSTVLESVLGADCKVGPFAYVRPGSEAKDQVKIGDFVEIKKTVIGQGSKVPHHSYLGDAEVGAGVNIGAGTITCNYDGKNKHKTVIGDKVFVGSNTNLVAPVNIGAGAVIGAGSTVNKNVPDRALGIARAKQKNIADWKKEEE